VDTSEKGLAANADTPHVNAAAAAIAKTFFMIIAPFCETEMICPVTGYRRFLQE
jgi:hypothetical protein